MRQMDNGASRKGKKALGQSGLPRADWIAKALLAVARKCHSLHSNSMLNRGYAYTTIISSKYHGQTLLSHLASLYPHSTPQAWQQKLNTGDVTLKIGRAHV